ncbi:DUF4837 family protein [candidate division KSB1 bacterium]
MYSENTMFQKKLYKLVILFQVLVLSVFCGCSYKPNALGNVNEIIVFADDGDWGLANQSIKQVFERTIVTPQEEKLYYVSKPPLSNLKLYQKYHNLILLGTLQSQGQVGDLIRANLTAENRQGVERGEKYAFQVRDVWASDQYMLILVAPTISQLIENVEENSNTLFNLVNTQANNFLRKSLYSKEEKVEVSKEIFEKYKFSFRVQHDYFMKHYPDSSAIFLRRFEPDRMIFIHWIDTTDVDYIPESWVVEKRKEIGPKYLDGREMKLDRVEIKMTNFANYNALETRGLWQDNQKFMGGPMLNYTFFDSQTSRIYMIDLAVFAPDEVHNKEPFIRQLEIIAKTFTTNPRYLKSQ